MIFFWLVIFIFIASGLYLLWQVPKISKTKGRVQQSVTSIIVPARNEADNLPILLASIEAQKLPPLEVILVDDKSTDATIQVAKKFGAKIVKNQSKWPGKAMSCYLGALEANGDYLLFLDADVSMQDEHTLASITQQFEKDQSCALSIQPYHKVQKLYEHLSVVFNIITLAGMNKFSILGNQLNSGGAFGPSLMVQRNLYFTVGGHYKVRDKIMENVELGQLIAKHHATVKLYSGYKTLNFRMYPNGVMELFQGWVKSIASGSAVTHWSIFIAISFWIVGSFFTSLFFIFSLIWNLNLISIGLVTYFLYTVLFIRMAGLSGNFNPFFLLFHNIFFSFFILTFLWSVIRTYHFKKVQWKGRKIKL